MKWNAWQPKDHRLRKGFQIWRHGEHFQALQIFQRAVARNENQPDAWRGLGSVLWSLRRFEEAAFAFRRSLALDCWNPMHWHNLGLAYRDSGNPDAAIRMLRFATEIDPGYEPAFNEWANVLVDQGRFEPALKLYDHALTLDDSRAVVHHNRGVCLLLLRDFVRAKLSFREALRRDPQYSHAAVELKKFRTVRLIRRNEPISVVSLLHAKLPISEECAINQIQVEEGYGNRLRMIVIQRLIQARFADLRSI